MNTPILWIVVFGVYIFILLWDGIRRIFKNNNAEQYYAAGRGVSNLALLATVAMSIFSGLTYYGYPGSVYKEGVGYLSGTGGYITALMFCTIGYRLWILGKEYGFKSPSEYLRNRYYSESYGFFVAALLFLPAALLLDSLLHEIAFWQTEAPVYTITQAGDGNIWLGTKGSGIIENTAGPSEAADYRPHRYAKSEDYYAPNSELIYDFNSDSPDRLWIASFDGSLSYIDMSDSERRFISKKNLLSFPTEQLNMMRHVSFGPDGKLYASGTLGLFVCPNPDADAQDLRFIRFPRVKDYDIQHILFTGGGELWASSSGNGFIRLESTSPDSDIRTFTTRSGLMSNFVLSAIEDRSGNIWIASNGGLNKFNPRTGSIIGYSYGRIGLNMRFNEGKPLMASDGKIYFNTTRGLMYFDPDEVSNSSFVPKILVNSLTVTGKRKNHDASGTVRMRKRDALNLNFSAIDLSAPERIIYYYMLDGRDRQWNSLGNDPRIHIDRLKPGKYSLRLRSTNGDGVFTDNEKTIELVVSPDFLPCLLLAVLFLGAAAFSLTRRRTLPSPGTEDDLDSAQRFRKEFSEYLAEHIDDGELNIAEMAAAMNMSRSNLHIKMKALTGSSAMDFIRKIRFSKACELLKDGRYSIADISSMVGFSSPAYFTTSFKKHIGCLPSEYVKK